MKQPSSQTTNGSSSMTLRRYVGGIGLFCVFLVIIGSGFAGARPLTIAERAVWFIGCYFTAFYLLEKVWRSWQEVSDEVKER